MAFLDLLRDRLLDLNYWAIQIVAAADDHDARNALLPDARAFTPHSFGIRVEPGIGQTVAGMSKALLEETAAGSS